MSKLRDASQVIRPDQLRPGQGREAVDPARSAVLARVLRASVERLARGILTVKVEGGGE